MQWRVVLACYLCLCVALLSGYAEEGRALESSNSPAVSRPSLPDPFSSPVTPIARVKLAVTNDLLERIHVQGVVTLAGSDSWAVIEDATGGIRIECPNNAALRKGDRVSVLGSISPDTALLSNTSVRVLGQAPLPRAKRLEPTRVLMGNYDGRLIELEGILVNQITKPEGCVLVVLSDRMAFGARLDPNTRKALPSFALGSWLRITGVCLMQFDPSHVAQSFQLAVSSPLQVAVVKNSPYFGQKLIFGFMVFVVAAITGAFVWIIILRRRVFEQTGVIRHRLENEAALEQRYQDLVNNAKEIIFSLDLDYRFTFINPMGQSILGLSQAALLGMPLMHWIAPEHAESTRKWLGEIAMRTSSATRELVLVSQGGGRIFLEVSFALSSNKSLPGVLHAIGRDVTERLRMTAEREQLIQELQEALKNVRTLSGLLPICANCKKIRDDRGYWNKIEKYVAAHSQVQFTHGICPECAEILYPELTNHHSQD